MNFLDGLEEDKTIKSDGDVLGGGSFIWDTGAYNVGIVMAYTGVSKGGAKCVTFKFNTPEGKNYTETMYVSSGVEKGGKNFYVDKKGVKRYLPGFTTVNHICYAATGKPLAEQEFEERQPLVYDKEQQKEVPTKKTVITSLLGKELIIGVQKAIENRREQNDEGEWEAVPDTRDTNEIVKVFTDKQFTVEEFLGEKEEPAFYSKWCEKFNSEFVKDRTDPKLKAKPVLGAKPVDTGDDIPF